MVYACYALQQAHVHDPEIKEVDEFHAAVNEDAGLYGMDMEVPAARALRLMERFLTGEPVNQSLMDLLASRRCSVYNLGLLETVPEPSDNGSGVEFNRQSQAVTLPVDGRDNSQDMKKIKAKLTAFFKDPTPMATKSSPSNIPSGGNADRISGFQLFPRRSTGDDVLRSPLGKYSSPKRLQGMGPDNPMPRYQNRQRTMSAPLYPDNRPPPECLTDSGQNIRNDSGD
eukprot:gene2091-18146_t